MGQLDLTPASVPSRIPLECTPTGSIAPDCLRSTNPDGA